MHCPQDYWQIKNKESKNQKNSKINKISNNAGTKDRLKVILQGMLLIKSYIK